MVHQGKQKTTTLPNVVVFRLASALRQMRALVEGGGMFSSQLREKKTAEPGSTALIRIVT
jgi:hypothetical protein